MVKNRIHENYVDLSEKGLKDQMRKGNKGENENIKNWAKIML